MAPDYYLKNFRFLIDHVVDQYADLLSDTETAFYRAFTRAGSDAQKLYVRMLIRKGDLFRADRLVYQEIRNSSAAADELKASRLININPPIATGELLPLFSKQEWLEKLGRREEYHSWVTALRKLKREEFNLLLAELLVDIDIFSLIKDDIYQLADSTIFDTFKLLFFGNLSQDLTEFVLNDLGLYRYEPYRIDKSSRLFNSRKQIEKHLEYYLLRDVLEDCLAAGSEFILELYNLFPLPCPGDAVLNRRIQKVFLKMARQLERLDCLDHALEIYRQCDLPPARERQARIHAKRNEFDTALAISREITDEPFDEEELLFATGFGQRIARKCNQPWEQTTNYQPGSEILTLDRHESVELAVAEYFSALGECHYVENALFCSVFGLHYWDVIFAPARGAFSHPFQARPHDLYERDFLNSRSTLFQIAQERLKDISLLTHDYLSLWQLKYGTLSPFIYWGALNELIITTAVERIPNAHWRKVFERLWQDPKANSSGFPDLVHFPSTGGYELIEVKGPGDRLQKNQLRWMHYFHRHGIPHKVIQVEWRQ